MKPEVVFTKAAPKTGFSEGTESPIAQGVKCGGFLFVSGQGPLDPVSKTIVSQDIAEQTVAALRATADPRDPRTAALVAELRSHDEFRSLWDRHDVRPTRDEIKRFDHPDAGRLTLRRQTLTIAGAEDHVIIVYQPEAGSPSADALAKLL